MLGPMPTASSAAATWQVPVVVVLVVAGALLIAGALAVAARADGPVPRPSSWRPFSDDDLPRFAAAPPGSAAPAPGPGAAARPAPGARTAVLAVAGIVSLLAAGAVTIAVATDAAPRPTASAATPETAQLSFGGVVLEQRAVGVTVTYPHVTIRAGSGGTAAHVTLPTFNCFADAPPADPLAAGCVRSLEEFADLTTPELSVVRETTGALRLSGRFATYVRPNGSPPEYTGRAYAITVTARPSGSAAAGEFRLDGGRTTTASGDGVSELRAGS